MNAALAIFTHRNDVIQSMIVIYTITTHICSHIPLLVTFPLQAGFSRAAENFAILA